MAQKKRLRLFLSTLSLAFTLGASVSAYAIDPIAKPIDPLSPNSQEKLVKSLRSFWKVLGEIPFDLYRCAGLFSKDGWTGSTLRRHPELAPALDKIYSHRLEQPSKFESVCFLNMQHDFEGISKNDYGVCAGVTAMNWIANYLSLYDHAGTTVGKFHEKFTLPDGFTIETFSTLVRKKEAEYAAYLKTFPEQQVKIVLDAEEEEILKFYTPFINRLFRERRPTVIPFFENMNSFSSHPAVRAYLEKMAVETWYDVNVSFSSILEVLLFGGHEGKKLRAFEVERLDKQLKAYLEQKIQPIIFIHLPSFEKHKKQIHVLRVLASEWKDAGDQLVVRVVDPNFEPGMNIWEIKITGVKKSPKETLAIYSPYQGLQTDADGTVRSLTDVEIAPFFDRLSVETLQAWQKFLKQDGEDALSRLSKPEEVKPKTKSKSKSKPPQERQ